MTPAAAPADRPALVLHIGLPKTGTTFLQRNVFGRADGITFLHRKRGPREGKICRGFRGFARVNDVLALGGGIWLRAQLRSFAAGAARDDDACLLVSEENMSVLATGFWTGHGADPERLSRRLARFAEASGKFLAPLKVIIGIRRQDQWLASRYAESSKHFPTFCQSDFERRMQAIAAGETLPGPLGWLDYDAVERGFARSLGRENVLLLPLERLSAAPEPMLDELGRFLGGVPLQAPPAPARQKAKRPARNQLSRGENLWKMRAGGKLRLEPAVQSAILARFAASNAALAARMPLGFEA